MKDIHPTRLVDPKGSADKLLLSFIYFIKFYIFIRSHSDLIGINKILCQLNPFMSGNRFMPVKPVYVR